ncbi:MAG: hypothetical protein ABI137_11150 [Antricoccus sp.]
MKSILIIAIIVIAIYLLFQYSKKREVGHATLSIDDSKAEARRWIERLGGQVLNLDGTDTASKQAMADASERFTAASSQIDQADTRKQAELAKESALEGLYYVRAARTAMGLDPGPELPVDRERVNAGAVSESRSVEVEGRQYEASPKPGEATPHYYPGGRVAGRAVPQGWYSEPWWKPALVAGAWGMGSALLFSSMFSGMSGIAGASAWEGGYDGGDMGGGYDGGGGDMGGGDMGGGYDGGGDMGSMDGGMDFGFDF